MPSPRHIDEESDWYRITSDFCNNYSHPASPTSLCLTSPHPRVPYLMSSSPSSCVPKSQVPTHASRCPRPLVPVPLLYTAVYVERNQINTRRLVVIALLNSLQISTHTRNLAQCKNIRVSSQILHHYMSSIFGFTFHHCKVSTKRRIWIWQWRLDWQPKLRRDWYLKSFR